MVLPLRPVTTTSLFCNQLASPLGKLLPHSRDQMLLLVIEIKAYYKATYCSEGSQKLPTSSGHHVASLEDIYNHNTDYQDGGHIGHGHRGVDISRQTSTLSHGNCWAQQRNTKVIAGLIQMGAPEEQHCTHEYLPNFRTATSSSASMPLHLFYQLCQLQLRMSTTALYCCVISAT